MKSNNAKKNARTLFAVIFTVLFFADVFLAAASVAGAYGKWDVFPGAFLAVETGSMEPDISAGDAVFAWNEPFSSLQVGNVVVFARDGVLVTHKIVKIQDGSVTTRGLANKFNDEPFSEKEYCGKVIFTIPGGAWAINAITSFWGIAAYAAIVLFLFYGYSLFRFIAGKFGKEKANEKFRFGFLRTSAALFVLSLILWTPYATEAKYTARLNEFFPAISTETHFTSNYLSEGGHDYLIQGWAGLTQNIEIDFLNSTNDLRYNKTGTDVEYTVYFEKIASENGVTYNTDYQITAEKVIDEDDIVVDDDNVEWYILRGNDDKSLISTHKFQVAITSILVDDNTNDIIAIPAGDSICFRIIAETAEGEGYYRRLEGKFVFQVATTSDFISSRELNTSVGNSLLTYSITTNMLFGAGSREVCIEWDATKLSLNTYEPTAFNIILKDPSRYVDYYTDPDDEDAPPQGRLTIQLQGYSRVELQFFKLDANSEIVANVDITANEIISE